MRRITLLSMAFLSVFCSEALGDQLTLKNGDRLSGQIVKTDGKSIVLKSEFAGTVAVQLDAVESITSDKPIHLTLSDGQVIVGTVTTAADKLEVQTAQAGRVEVTRSAVTAIRSESEQNAYQAEIDRYRNPGLLDLWSGFLDTGLSLTRGNSDTTTFTLGFNADRITPRDKTSVYTTSLYSTGEDRESGEKETIANAIRGGARYELKLTDRLNAFAFGDLEHDEFQELDLRLVLGGGLGWDVIKNERTVFNVFGGGALNKEFFTIDEDRTSGEALIGEELNHRVSDRFALKQRMVFFPNLTETGEYRLTFDGSAVTTLNKWLSWHVTLSDRFISNPAADAQKNDLLLTTGIRLTFKR